jgi:hypothetical protein
MKKDAYYFPHFCNARHDRKIKRLIKDFGLEGYGIYFMILEILREQQDFRYPIKDIDLLADEIGATETKVRSTVLSYDLFQVDEHENFFSIKFIYYLTPYLEKTERAREAANKRWNNLQIEQKTDANAYANAEQMQCVGNASAMQGKERKGKEIKEENNINIIPNSIESDKRPEKKQRKHNEHDVWRTDIDAYKKVIKDASNMIIQTESMKHNFEALYPNCDLIETIKKAMVKYWMLESTWLSFKKKIHVNQDPIPKFRDFIWSGLEYNLVKK